MPISVELCVPEVPLLPSTQMLVFEGMLSACHLTTATFNTSISYMSCSNKTLISCGEFCSVPKVTVLPSIKSLILEFLIGGRLVTGALSHVSIECILGDSTVSKTP